MNSSSVKDLYTSEEYLRIEPFEKVAAGGEINCVECRSRSNYHIVAFFERYFVRDILVETQVLKAICDNCGKEVYVPLINDINVVLREEAYKRGKLIHDFCIKI